MQTNKTVLAYLRRIGANGGKKTSEAKKAACRANGNENSAIRYVGKTHQPLGRRLMLHLGEAGKGVVTHKCCWIRSMIILGLSPNIEIVKEVGDGIPENIFQMNISPK